MKSIERNVRTLLVSDIHLGSRYSQCENFLNYLNGVRPEKLYLLGDFLDGWELRSGWRWTPAYSQICNRLLDLAEGGTELYYTPGNHDAFLRCPEIGRLVRRSGVCVDVEDEFTFDASDGRRFVVMHGDRFDTIEMQYQWLSVALTQVYAPLLALNCAYNRMSGRRHGPYTGCAYVKNRAKRIARFFSHFEERLFEYVHERHSDGIICGHIHTPGIVRSAGATYINTGDWMENCTALVEHENGEIVLESYYSENLPQTAEPPRAFRPEPILDPVSAGEYAPAFAERAVPYA